MKNQWFGDRKDIFKFSICRMVLKTCDLKKFTWIAMYTPNEYEDSPWIDRRVEEFFKNHIRRICKIYDLFDWLGDKHIKVELIDKEFKPNDRENYFSSIPEHALSEALVLVDPDTGIAFDNSNNKKSKNSEKHIFPCEIKTIFRNMNTKSVLSIFQHRHRTQKLSDHIDQIKKKLTKEIPDENLLILGWKDSIIILIFKDK